VTTPNDVALIRSWWALDRDADVSGVSGTGRVAYALDLPGFGTLVLWDTRWKTVDFRESLAQVAEISGHGGATRLTPLDPDADAAAIERARTMLADVGHRAYATLAVATTRLP
jgi:hypothetical protein